MAEKYYLDSEGLEALVNFINDALAQKAGKNDIPTLPNDVVRTADIANFITSNTLATTLNDYAEKSSLNNFVLQDDFNSLDSNVVDLRSSVQSLETNSATKSELENYATLNELEVVRGLATGVYHFRGNVADLNALQAIKNPAAGDVYNITSTGMNAAWTGEMWDEFGTTVDLSEYAKKDEIQALTLAQINAILYNGSSAVVSSVEGIQAMLANDEPEVTITLNKNIAAMPAMTVPTGKKVTLDLGGNSLAASNTMVRVAGGEVVLKNGTISGAGDSYNRPVVVTSGKVVVDGASVSNTRDCAISATGANAEVVIEDGKVTAQEAGVLVTSGATLTVNGGEIEGTDNSPIMGNGTPGQGNVNIVMNGGKLIAHITTPSYIACGVYMPNDGSFTMNGGEIISDGCGICMRGGQVNLNGGSIIANGESGVTGKVGDSRVVVGPYAVVYDAQSKYPAMDSLELNIGKDMILQGTDGDIDYVLQDGITANVNDERG